jgi:hypothetical protein
MSWINTLNWWQWFIMAILPPLVILLYFLKLRRMPVEVPSTYLWRRALEDLHVNSIWQRLRNNLLLWLQLLVLALMILALLRPGIRSDQKIESRSILMIDHSASMQATDLGKSRLELAKEKALELVSTMSSDDVAMVIAFSDRADVRQGFTSDQRRLRAAIESIQPSERTTDLNEALRTASGLATPGRTGTAEEAGDAEDTGDAGDAPSLEANPAHLYLISDGRFSTPSSEFENLTAEFIPIGSSEPENIAILAFTSQRAPEKPGLAEAFARLQNFGSQPAQAEVTLRLDGQLIDAMNVDLEPGSIRGLNFELTDVEAGRLELSLQTDDDLSVDNVAYAALTPPRQLEVVLATEGNPALVAALNTPQAIALANVRTVRPDELESDSIKQLSASGTVDLFIYDACAPPMMPEANTLFFGQVPPAGGWQASEPIGPLFVIDYQRDHPLLQYVDFGLLLIAEGVSLAAPGGAVDLIRTDEGVLMAIVPRARYQDAVIGLDLRRGNTNWPNRRSFPIFILNSLEFLGGATSAAGAKNVRPGQPAILDVASRFDGVRITTPSGNELAVQRDGQSQIVFSQSDETGFYEVKDPNSDRLLQLFTANLFSEQESQLKPTGEVTLGLQELKAETEQVEMIRVEYWRWLLVLVLVAICVEWLVYSKRISL